MSSVVPFLDLQAPYRELRADFDAAAARVMSSGWYIHGEELDRFEAEYARAFDASHCVGVGNGLDALTLTLRAAGIGPGDEVIVPAHTFIATWLAATAVGARVVPVDPDETTYNLTAELVSKKLTPQTRAIIVVHLYGRPVELDGLVKLARDRGILLVEDAAQAHGASYRGKPIGAHGDAATWSFYPAKNLGALGDGGAVTTNNAELARKIRLLRQYGSERKYHHELQGVNSRLDPLQAAFLALKLPHLPRWNERRRQIARQYLSELAGLDLELPPADDHVVSSWHLFVVRSTRRDELHAALERAGVQTVIHYPTACHLQPAYSGAFGDCDLPVSRRLAAQVLSLPIGPHQTDEQTARVIAAVRQAA